MYRIPEGSEHLRRYRNRLSKPRKDNGLLLQVPWCKMASLEHRLHNPNCLRAQLKLVQNTHLVQTQPEQLLRLSRRVQHLYARTVLQHACEARLRKRSYPCGQCFQSTTRLYHCHNRHTSQHKHHQHKFLGNRSVVHLIPLAPTSRTATSPRPGHRLCLHPRHFSHLHICSIISG
jgi:hypothetical protein